MVVIFEFDEDNPQNMCYFFILSKYRIFSRECEGWRKKNEVVRYPSNGVAVLENLGESSLTHELGETASPMEILGI